MSAVAAIALAIVACVGAVVIGAALGHIVLWIATGRF